MIPPGKITEAGSRPKPQTRRTSARALHCAPALVFLAATTAWGQPASQVEPTASLKKRGADIIRRFVEVNRYWLVRPPAEVRDFSYVLNRIGATQRFSVTEPGKTPRAKLQGVTYSAMLHQVAKAPRTATVREIVEEPGRVRLVLGFDPAIRGACGNGVEGSWNGYHSLGGAEGFVVIDTQRWVPLEAQFGRLHERFGDFVQLDAAHYVPLKIQVQMEETTYDWRFRVYEPGLWLFDDSFWGGRRLAWIEDVKVNSSSAKVRHITESSAALARDQATGNARLEEFLNANRHWLLPLLQARRGLVYEYRQESPYRELVWFDAEGNLLARLESTKDSPGQPTRQALWLADGRSYRGIVSDRFVGLASPQHSNSRSIQSDRLTQHLAMGLALDCALTRLAREPEQFWAEMRRVPSQANRYLLVLHPKRDARLFTGTMLAFSSWCFMHDVFYDRSEVLCDAATHRPIEEKDYAGPSDLKGHYIFDNWLDDAGGAAPGRIRAVVPHEKDGRDQSLEMTAEFGFPKPGLWLLKQVTSHFRGTDDGSIGTVNVLADSGKSFAEIGELLEKAQSTGTILSGIKTASDGEAIAQLPGTNWTKVPVKAEWTEPARQSLRDHERNEVEMPLLGVFRARAVQETDAAVQIELEGVSTASWKEFLTTWKARLTDERGAVFGTGTADLRIRAEAGPSPFTVHIEIARRGDAPVLRPMQVAISGLVQRLTGAYHGHSIWYTFFDEK